ncbi:Catenin-beta-like protein [Clohesyomyces aquaticus]|uniref:Catenin-beta-like protein n=1 Tax=Clohesyomyces aquaticus TaxID=1231657 RepID=A0A1Y1ZWP3_9PLEO|nr:Catenin-beta-like protein [Clohesyomyces aquaticus]
MSNIDELFKLPNLPAKRKFENPSGLGPTHAYKSAKLDAGRDVKRSQASAKEEEEEEDDEAGPELPPDMEEEAGDDEEGRFFGGGLDEDAKEAIDILDANDAEEAYVEEKFDIPWLRKLALNFEKKVNKNAELRAKFEDDPSKFIASEGDLDETIKTLSILSEHAELYQEFAKLGSASSLVSLLAHENSDIAINAIEIISELTDEDVEAAQEQWDALVAVMLEADLLNLLISNFSRFDESVDADANGVYQSLSVIENLLSQPTNLDMIGKEKKLIKWLLNRIKVDLPITQNKQYSTEILSILIQSSVPNRRRVIEADGIDVVLTSLSAYLRHDPEKDSDEEEYMENLFNCTTSLADEPEGKEKFLEAEGVELCLFMLKSGRICKTRALKVLDHACGYAEGPPAEETKTNGASPNGKGKGKQEPDQPSTNRAAAVCEMVVEKGGLKPLFSTFKATKNDPETTEHFLGIFASLLRSLPGNSDSRVRLLVKFSEKNYEKVGKLVAFRREYASRVEAFDAKLAAQKRGLSKQEQDEIELENIPTRLEEGLYCLERVDVILAWLVAEDAQAKKAVVGFLAERDESLVDVRKTLQAQLNGVLEVEPAEREMLESLVSFLG